MDPVSISLGMIVLRIGLAITYLLAAFAHTLTSDGWNVTIRSTALLLRLPETAPQTRMAAVAALIWLWLSGLGVLFGLLTVISALAVAAFAVLGMVIHSRETQKAFEMVAALRAVHGDSVQLERLGYAAVSGNRGAGVKNVLVIAAAITLVIIGPGIYSLDHMLGF